MEITVTVPLYSHDLSFEAFVPEREALKLERGGLAKLVRKRNGCVARAIKHKRPGDPDPMKPRDYLGKNYSFNHHLEDGHRPWTLKPLTGKINPRDNNIEYHLAPSNLRPIFVRVLLDCVVKAA